RMAAIGEHALAFMEALEQVKPRHWHEMCSGILHLSKTWPAPAIDRSCQRALYYRALSYRKVKAILEDKLWQLPMGDTVDQIDVSHRVHGHSLAIYDHLTTTPEANYGSH